MAKNAQFEILKNKEKQKADLETGTGLLDFLYTRSEEVVRIQTILRSIPKSWRKTILMISEKNFPRLCQTIRTL